MNTPLSLRGYLLVAMPSLRGGAFEQSVIYICEHQPEGAVGLIINQPMHYPLSFMFDQLQIESGDAKKKNQPLLFGGPVQPERGFVIHRPCGSWRSSLLLGDDVTVTTSNDIIRAIAENDGPADALVALGFVSWEAGQLEQEIETDQWMVCNYQSEILYDTPFEKRWEKTPESIGVNVNQLIGKAGHA
jgi:putative transcriptional regulator